MTLFALICTDKPNAASVRAETRPNHLAYIDAHKAQVKIAGPFTSEDGKSMLGSLIIVEAADMAAARTFAANDPYALAGLFQSVEIKPWRWIVGAPKE
jgi:uncharacterized protein YciI